MDGNAISFINIAAILEPFLYAISNIRNNILVQRIKEKIFLPLLENNITPAVEDEDENSKSEETK